MFSRSFAQSNCAFSNAGCSHGRTESRRVPNKSQTTEPFVGAVLRLEPVAATITDPVVVLRGVAVAVGAVLIGSGPVILTSPNSPPTRQAKAYSFQSATLDRQELTLGYATMASYVCVVVEVTVERTVPSVGYGTTSQVEVSVPLAS
jgi:hypothetical protein